MNDLFAHTWTLVTGASSGLGDVFARRLAARGANLVLTARRGDRLDALAGELHAAHGIETRTVALDLGAPGGADRLCADVDALGVEITHLISNAGFGLHGEFTAAPAAQLAEMVRLNCEALTVVSRHFLPGMRARRAGGIVHVASVAAFQPTPYMAVYGATKAFVLSLSEALAEEVRADGVRVMALNPGPVPTGFQGVAGADIAPAQRAAVMTSEQVVDHALADYEAGRTSSVPGLANRVQTLASGLLPRALIVRATARVMRGKRGAGRG